jgi:hypothetical protein
MKFKTVEEASERRLKRDTTNAVQAEIDKANKYYQSYIKDIVAQLTDKDKTIAEQHGDLAKKDFYNHDLSGQLADKDN